MIESGGIIVAGFVANNYWSSTPVPLYSTTQAYNVNMTTGDINNNNMTNNNYVRCVR